MNVQYKLPQNDFLYKNLCFKPTKSSISINNILKETKHKLIKRLTF
jgi:hypothetical protein